MMEVVKAIELTPVDDGDVPKNKIIVQYVPDKMGTHFAQK